jgi:cytoskeletal protein CcmA (bactofilin family)
MPGIAHIQRQADSTVPSSYGFRFKPGHQPITISGHEAGFRVDGRNSQINNRGSISGDVNAVDFANGGKSSGQLNNAGAISSDSQGVNIGGNGVTVNNNGSITGTGDPRERRGNRRDGCGRRRERGQFGPDHG